ncbi:MAG: hypothetical protein LBE75_08805 [Burkholderiales bacterium]|jgi:hypothetical protein|nr:hypothetical protein [Burkholderiales bacterium]
MRPKLDPDRYAACPSFNDWLDEQYSDESGDLNILGFRPRPSEVLFTMSPDTYQANFPDFMQQREEEILDLVFNNYPSPIAYYFYRFKNGYENEIQRLLLLRDTWEAIVDVLHALAIAECRFHKIHLSAPLKFKDLLTDSIAQRLENIEEIAKQMLVAGIASEFSKIVKAQAVAAMRDLNQSRNAFSHSAAQSETQARNWVDECHDDVLNILGDLDSLQSVQIIRYLGQPDALTIRGETFKGHGATRTIQTVPLDEKQIQGSSCYFQQGHMLAFVGKLIFSLKPTVHYREDVAGHMTRLCVFRRTHGDVPNRKIEFEVVGESARIEENRKNFFVELTELRGFFGLGDD